MKIGILTQPLHSNYGGILQNYALQQVLKDLGHEPLTIDRHSNRPENFIKKPIKRLLQIIKSEYESGYLTKSQKDYIYRHQFQFIKDNIIKTPRIYTQDEFDNYVKNADFDAFVVGSDQCWRPRYTPNIYNNYLDFASEKNIKKIVYAASFGVDTWEYSEEDTIRVKNLSSHLDSISVREQSGIELCRKHLGVQATWVLDPTMLLGREGFQHFVSSNRPKGITTYFLESNSRSYELVQRVIQISGLSDITDNLSDPIFHRFDSIEKHVNLPIEQWIGNIANAKIVITDSFHGAVFAILFNVPFLVKLNGIRGNARIESLLRDFGLEECICSSSALTEIPRIDWDRVNRHLKRRQESSLNFLKDALR